MPRSSSGSVPVIGRFSLSGGLPDQRQARNRPRSGVAVPGERPAVAHGDGQHPVFLDSTPQGFYERILASKPMPDTGKADPQKMAAFLDRHPETVAAMKIINSHPPLRDSRTARSTG